MACGERRLGAIVAALAIGALAASCGRCAPGRDDADDRPAVRVSAPAPVEERCDPAQPRQCVGSDVVACEPEGRLGRRLQTCREGCEDGACVATCADDGSKLIYVVDDAGVLQSFDPRKLPADPFQRVGQLRCGRDLGETFSMSVDRRGMAWVVFRNGEIYKVSIADARCRPTRYRPGAARFLRFGMGFVTDEPGGSTEQLYLASDDPMHALGALDPARDPSLTPRAIGKLVAAEDRNPELTGTSDARLFGFYPPLERAAFVQEINRATGGPIGPRWTLGDAPLGDVTAYAFAQWAGLFYVFVTVQEPGGFNSTVRVVDPSTGRSSVVLERLRYRITGAGVSTCAPARDR